MNLTKRGFLLSLALGLSVMLAAACGGTKEEAKTGAPGAPGAQEVRTPQPAGAYTPAPRDQQAFRVAWSQPEFMDPHKSNFAQDIALERLLSRPLFCVD